MKKLPLFVACLLAIGSLRAQTQYPQSSFADVGDKFPRVTYQGVEGTLLSDFGTEDVNFGEFNGLNSPSIDTLEILSSSEADMLISMGIAAVHANKTQSSLDVLDLSIPEVEQFVQLGLGEGESLKMVEFPMTESTDFTDNASGESPLPLATISELLQGNAGELLNLIDSARVVLEIASDVEVVGISNVQYHLPNKETVNYDCLKEKSKMSTTVDVEVHLKFPSMWISISDVPIPLDNLPISFPIEKIMCSVNYWNPNFGWSLVSVDTKEDWDSVNNVKFMDAEPSAIGNVELVDIGIYPNPSTDKVFVSIDDKSLNLKHIEIIDMSGKVINTFPIHEKFFTFAVNDLEAGSYFVRFADHSNNTASVKKIIVH